MFDKLKLTRKQMDKFIEKWANIFATSTLSDGGTRKEVKQMLKEYDEMKRVA